MAGRLEGKIAVITGAGSGMGKAMAEIFSAQGARVVLADISGRQNDVAAALNAAASGGGANAAVAVPVHCDVSSESDVQNMIATAEREFGRLDVLCNNAGFGGPMAPLHEQSIETWEKVHATNIKGAFLGMKYGIISMLKSGGGAIVNTTSASGVIGWKHHSVYGAAKAGVNQLTKAAALDYSDRNIRINAIAPAGINTSLTTGFQVPPDIDFELMAPYTGYRGMGEANDIANLFAWMASDEASNMHGSIVSSDRGVTAG